MKANGKIAVDTNAVIAYRAGISEVCGIPFPTQLLNITEDEERIEKTIRLLDEWMADESGYDEETWPEIKAALNRERDNVSARRLFDE